MKELEKHINNLEEYCKDDDLFEKDGDFKEFCDNHIADIQAVIKELKNIQADLYEANNRINDLLEIVTEKDKLIYKIACAFRQDDVRTVEEIIEYFEKEVQENE